MSRPAAISPTLIRRVDRSACILPSPGSRDATPECGGCLSASIYRGPVATAPAGGRQDHDKSAGSALRFFWRHGRHLLTKFCSPNLVAAIGLWPLNNTHRRGVDT